MQSNEWRYQNFDRHRYRDFFFRYHNFFPRPNSLKPKPRLVFRDQILRHWNRNPQKMAKVSTPLSFENEMSISGAVLSKSDLRDDQELPELEGTAPGWACERRNETLKNLFVLHFLFPCIYFSSCIYFQASFHLETQQVQAVLQVHLVPNWLPEVEGGGSWLADCPAVFFRFVRHPFYPIEYETVE